MTLDRPAPSPTRYISSVVFVIKLVNTGSYSTTLFSSVLFDFVVIIDVWVCVFVLAENCQAVGCWVIVISAGPYKWWQPGRTRTIR